MKKVPKSLKVKTSETQWLQILQLQVMSLHPSRRNSQRLHNQPTPHALFYFLGGIWPKIPLWASLPCAVGALKHPEPDLGVIFGWSTMGNDSRAFFGWVMWYWGWSCDFDDVGFWWRRPWRLIFSSAPKIDSDLPIPNHEIWIYDVQKRVTWHQKWSCDMENVTWWIMWHFRTIDVVLRCRTF